MTKTPELFSNVLPMIAIYSAIGQGKLAIDETDTSRDVTVVEKIYSNSHGIEITTMNNEYETYDHFISGGTCADYNSYLCIELAGKLVLLVGHERR